MAPFGQVRWVDRAKGSHPQGKVLAEDFTEDTILNGRVRIRQPVRGYRVNIDTILLAAAIEGRPGQRLLEVGCGVGAALLAVAVRTPDARLVGLERDSAAAACARHNVIANGLSGIVEIVEGDVLDRDAVGGGFDAVFVNPPFDQEGEGRAPAAHRRHAHVADAPFRAWVGAVADRLVGGGALTLIHRASKLPGVLAGLQGRLGGVEVLPIRPRAGEPAKRVLVRARKGSRAPFKLLAGIDLHDRSGAKYTPAIEAVVRGDALLAWGD